MIAAEPEVKVKVEVEVVGVAMGLEIVAGPISAVTRIIVEGSISAVAQAVAMEAEVVADVGDMATNLAQLSSYPNSPRSRRQTLE